MHPRDFLSYDERSAILSWKNQMMSVDSDYAFEINGWTRPGHFGEGKCLPYDDWKSLRQLQEIGCHLYENCLTTKSAINKMISYVIGSGHSYEVVRRSVPKSVSRGVSVSDSAIEDIRQIIEYTMENSYPGGWQAMQEESIVRLFREGEYFRRIFATDDGVAIRFVEPFYIQSPDNDPNRNRDLGIVSSPGDAVTIESYWLMSYDESGNKEWSQVPSGDLQHCKQGVDANDPRGIPVLWTTFCQSQRIPSINEAMCKLAVTQAAYAVVRQYDNTVTLERMRDIARGMQDARQTNGDPTPGTEVEAKGFTFEFPSMDVDARSFVEIIHQQQRDIAGILDMPEFIISNDTSKGNRSSLIAAEGPFDRRVQREQASIGAFDVEVLWKSVQSIKGWSDERLARVRRIVKIETKYPRASTRDESRTAKMLIDLVDSGLKSPQSAIAELGGEYEMTQSQIDEYRSRVGEPESEVDPS